MMKPLTIALLGALLCASLPAQQNAVTPSHTNLKVGDMAPDFTLPATTGDKITLSSFRGKTPVVMAFFPAAFTGGSTQAILSYDANSPNVEAPGHQDFAFRGAISASL